MRRGTVRPRVMLATVLALTGPAILASAGPAVSAAAQSAPAIEITGATYAELDDASGVWTLRGAPVVVRRGLIVLHAPAIAYDTRAQLLRAGGGVVYADEVLTLEARSMTVWLDDERLLAEDGVRAAHPGASLRLTAARLEVYGKEQRLVATGAPAVTSPEGTITADRIEAFAREQELIAEGTVRIVREDIDGRAPRLRLQRREAVAVLSGGAVVRQGASEARAPTIAVDLRRRRITASGGATLTVQTGR